MSKTITTVIKSDFVDRVKSFVEGESQLDGLGYKSKIDDPLFLSDPENPEAPVPQVDNPVSWDQYLGGAMMSEIYDRMFRYESKKARDNNNKAFIESQKLKVESMDSEKDAFIR